MFVIYYTKLVLFPCTRWGWLQQQYSFCAIYLRVTKQKCIHHKKPFQFQRFILQDALLERSTLVNLCRPLSHKSKFSSPRREENVLWFNHQAALLLHRKKKGRKIPPPLLKLQKYGQYFVGAAIPPSPSSVDDKPRTFAIGCSRFAIGFFFPSWK